MIGGGRSFDDGGYANTPLAEILPVALTGQNRYRAGAGARAILTEAGTRHPITHGLSDEGANQPIRRLPPLDSFNSTEKALFGETLLSLATDARQGSKNPPLLVVAKAGKGRVASLMTDDLWKWNFVAVGEGGNNQAHLRLVAGMVRWLVQEPSLEQVKIIGISRPSSLGGRAEVRVRVLKDDYSPAPQASLHVTLKGPEGDALKPDVDPMGNGEFTIGFLAAKEGSFSVDVEARADGKSLGRAQKGFVMSFDDIESEDGRPRSDRLERLAEKSGGQFVLSSKLTPDRKSTRLNSSHRL